MIFKRRNPRSYAEIVSESVYPRGGWQRALRYVALRLRRLPDPAHKISRGIAAGVFMSFTPFFGLHFFLAALLAVMIRGNVLAALLATFFGNPLTFPLIASVSTGLGYWMVGQEGVPLPDIVWAFADASLDFWRNFLALFTPETANWRGLGLFLKQIFVPYLVGGLTLGVAAGAASYFLSAPLIAAYQKARVNRLKKRFAKKRKRAMARRAGAPAE
ncbi:MAG: DUF2062 domain-containing protein [Boseongicola sp. SB0662_bin_57]|nr:DUF2062 domain-containing protein [Boseongicola sp. SB0662_bin_57]